MRYKLTIEYDGTAFSGWQKQQNKTTIQEVLEKAFTIALRQPIEVQGSGRTDAGVHALGQVAHFDYSDTLSEQECGRLRESINALVRPYPVSVHDITQTTEDFHARFSARQREYLYRIQNTRFPPALDRERVWWFSRPLDTTKMQEAADLLIGKHDFSTFRASQCQAKSPVKTLDTLTITRQADIIDIRIKARSFLYHQVRNITGSLVYVGCGKWSVDDFKHAFEACDRTKGGETAPASGLYFVGVRY